MRSDFYLQTKDRRSLDYSSNCYIWANNRIGWVSMKEIFNIILKSWMNVEMIMENCPITILTIHTYKYYSNYCMV